MTTSAILAIQLHAVRTGNRSLLATAWRALGRDSQYAFAPVTPREQAEAIETLRSVAL